MNLDIHWLVAIKLRYLSVRLPATLSQEFLLEMCTLRECGLYGILVAIGLTFTQPVGWEEDLSDVLENVPWRY